MESAGGGLSELEDLTLCSCCNLPFNETDQIPKLLACRHHFCLKCINTVLLKGRELYCMHCWKRTDDKPDNMPTYTAVLALTQNLSTLSMHTTKESKQHTPKMKPSNTLSENCHTHAMPYTLWCLSCQGQTCRACATAPEHSGHQVKPHAEAKEVLRADAQAELATMHKMLADMQHLVLKQRDFLLKILDACTTLKTKVETDLVNHTPSYELADARDGLGKAKLYLNLAETQSPNDLYRLLSDLSTERHRLQARYQDMYLQCKLDDLIRHSGVLFDFELLKQALSSIHNSDLSGLTNGPHCDPNGPNPILLLANYCMSQLYSRHYLSSKQACQNGNSEYSMPQMLQLPPPQSPKPPAANSYHGADNAMAAAAHLQALKSAASNAPSIGFPEPVNKPGGLYLHEQVHSSQSSLVSPNGVQQQQQQQQQQQLQPIHSPQQPMIRNPSHAYPIFYFNIEINGTPFGRILIEVRSDVAPKMAKNFSLLCTGDLGIGYKGCNVFQCWENESIITGDFELNNGRGGRSVFEEGFFMPDDTKILAIRGSVGMRRSQKRHDNLGLVGSQFRIILREMRGFTGIFAFVVEGLDLVERISQSGDSAGKPQSSVVIASCGKLN